MRRLCVLAHILKFVHPFQTHWLHNNWDYGLADEVTEKLSGKSWGTYVPAGEDSERAGDYLNRFSF